MILHFDSVPEEREIWDGKWHGERHGFQLRAAATIKSLFLLFAAKHSRLTLVYKSNSRLPQLYTVSTHTAHLAFSVQPSSSSQVEERRKPEFDEERDTADVAISLHFNLRNASFLQI